MPRNIDYAHVPSGEFGHKCITCGIIFRSDDIRYKYCSLTCYKKYHNNLYYQRHKVKIKKRMKTYMRQKRNSQT